MSVNQQNSSFVMSFADKMQQGFSDHSLTKKISDQKITSHQTPNIFDSSTNIAQKNTEKNGLSDYQQIEQEYRKIEFIEKFQKKVQHAMSKAKDHLELYRIYQTNLKEIEGQFKDNLQNGNEEFKKLSQDHQNKIAKINKDYYDLLEIKKTENLDFLEMIKNARSELEIAEKTKI